jgi:16S rRNA processing protein RimM
MIGEIVRPHGLAGVVKVRPTTDDAGRFALLKQVQLQRGESRLGEFAVEAVQIGKAEVLLKFRGVNDRDSAEQLRGAGLMIAREECLPTGPDQFYLFDIIGLPVYTAAGELIGEIIDIETYPANDVWVVRREGQEKLIPAIKSVIQEVDLKNGRVVITPIPGLLEDVPE